MGNILKIAAGVVIGLLVFQILMYKKIDADYENSVIEVTAEQGLRNRYTNLTNTLHSYYRKHSDIPEYVADLSCIDVFNNWKEIECPYVQKDGVFYINHESDWASAEPYIFDGELYIKCKMSRKLPDVLGEYKDCEKLDIASVPERKYPEFGCNRELDTVQKLICSSDRLTDIENELSAVYEKLLSESSNNNKQEIEDDRDNFLGRRLSECDTSDCVEELTRKKIKRLEILGVYKK